MRTTLGKIRLGDSVLVKVVEIGHLVEGVIFMVGIEVSLVGKKGDLVGEELGMNVHKLGLIHRKSDKLG